MWMGRRSHIHLVARNVGGRRTACPSAACVYGTAGRIGRFRGARIYVERSDGILEPREVEMGWRFGERVEILRGVLPGEPVVVEATFLVNSESRLETPASGTAPARTTGKPA